MKVILLNGAARSGKDTAAKALVRHFPGCVRIGFADHLKVATHAAYGLIDATGVPYPYDTYEHTKDEPHPDFFGLKPRKAYIEHSEHYMKPLHGTGVFGKIWLRAALRSQAPIVAVPDSGFVGEALVVISKVGAENVLLIRVIREGCTFVGDSRSHISLPVTTRTIDNNDSPLWFEEQVVAVVESWLAA